MPWADIVVGLVPSIGVLGIFLFVMRAVIRADRREREALAKIDAAQENKLP